MSSAMASILRAVSRRPGERMNVLTYSTHERYQSGWTNVPANFYLIQGPGIKTWNPIYAPLPANHIVLNGSKSLDDQIPVEVDFDLILSQNKAAHYPSAKYLSQKLHLPLVSLEHCMAHPSLPRAQLEAMKGMRGHENVFISEFSRRGWGWGDDEAKVIHHGVDSDRFCPNDSVEKENKVLSICNDFINRDPFCGYRLWEEVSRGLPRTIVGDTPGLSVPANGLDELVRFYRQSRVFLNTSLFSPIPTVVLEAMSAGLPIVSTANCMLPEVIEHGVNGFLSNSPQDLRSYVELLLSDEKLAQQMGRESRRIIVERFSLSKFVDRWSTLFEEASRIVFRG